MDGMSVLKFPDRDGPADAEPSSSSHAEEARVADALRSLDELVADRAEALAKIDERTAQIEDAVGGMSPQARRLFLMRARVDGDDEAVRGPRLRAVPDPD